MRQREAGHSAVEARRARSGGEAREAPAPGGGEEPSRPRGAWRRRRRGRCRPRRGIAVASRAPPQSSEGFPCAEYIWRLAGRNKRGPKISPNLLHSDFCAKDSQKGSCMFCPVQVGLFLAHMGCPCLSLPVNSSRSCN